MRYFSIGVMENIRYVKHKHIDQTKWDACISRAYNGMVYPYSFFLNSMAGKRWDALILGDYEAVMPLVWKKKFGFKYLYQPYFCQQLGVYSLNKITSERMQAFMLSIPKSFKYWNMHLNYENTYYGPKTTFINRSSYCIDLKQNYAEIYDQYNADAKKNLAKAIIEGYEVENNCPIELVADCFFAAYGQHYPKTNTLKKLISHCAHKAINLNKGFTRAIYDKQGQLLCAGFFFQSNKRIHYAMAAPTEAGKKLGATHILIDEVLKAYAGSDQVFDFEGSDIQSVAYFYAKFGSVCQHYLQIIQNNLPWWCRFLKN